MKLMCKSFKYDYPSLTAGRMYNVTQCRVRVGFYWVDENDHGRMASYLKGCFMTQQEHRTVYIKNLLEIDESN